MKNKRLKSAFVLFSPTLTVSLLCSVLWGIMVRHSIIVYQYGFTYWYYPVSAIVGLGVTILLFFTTFVFCLYYSYIKR